MIDPTDKLKESPYLPDSWADRGRTIRLQTIEIERLKAQSGIQWISVKGRLPDTSRRVLAINDATCIFVCEIIENEWQHKGEDIITHWAEISLPKETEK